MGLIGCAAAYGQAQSTPRMYKSTASVFVSTQRGDTTTELVQGSTFAQNLIQSYAQLAEMPSVLDPVITKLGLDTTAVALAKSISSDTPLNTVLINISATNSSPAKAAEIANAVSASLATTAQNLAPKSANGAPAISMQQVAEAQPAAYAFAPNTKLMMATGLLGGLAVGVVWALARQIFNTRLRLEADLRHVSRHPLIGKIWDRGHNSNHDIVFRDEPHGQDAESFRRLAANLQFLNPDLPVRSIVVTSAQPGDGKSGIAINLSLALAERFDKVLLIDGDLRRPMVATYCGIEGGVGLTTVLAGAVELAEVIEPWAPSISSPPEQFL
ncbi:YveK family protein [Arthrobacter psychrolactophilus]